MENLLVLLTLNRAKAPVPQDLRCSRYRSGGDITPVPSRSTMRRREDRDPCPEAHACREQHGEAAQRRGGEVVPRAVRGPEAHHRLRAEGTVEAWDMRQVPSGAEACEPRGEALMSPGKLRGAHRLVRGAAVAGFVVRVVALLTAEFTRIREALRADRTLRTAATSQHRDHGSTGGQ